MPFRSFITYMLYNLTKYCRSKQADNNNITYFDWADWDAGVPATLAVVTFAAASTCLVRFLV